MPTDPRVLLHRLVDDLSGALGDDLLALYVHGSWVLGDFAVDRSDLDLLAIVRTDPTAATMEVLTSVHARIDEDHPEWAGRLEVEYLTYEALTDFRSRPRPMARISPGEPLHLVPATRHYLINWYVARRQGFALLGPEPAELMPDIGDAEFWEAVTEHAAAWSQWVREMRTPGAQAYAVLSPCRALYTTTQGTQTSKRQAASFAAKQLPRSADLIRWAERWWYAGGPDPDADRLPEVTRFAGEVSDLITGLHPRPGDCRLTASGHPRGRFRVWSGAPADPG